MRCSYRIYISHTEIVSSYKKPYKYQLAVLPAHPYPVGLSHKTEAFQNHYVFNNHLPIYTSSIYIPIYTTTIYCC